MKANEVIDVLDVVAPMDENLSAPFIVTAKSVAGEVNVRVRQWES
ncbi:hypothetical protein LF1_16260 [Rubripirellula obstinata]|uniref:Uncharacterized protein n=1 Tax=Rubripirellula obstinata TaxID=406547 RepID=A0A5B1CD63_9BACT|nr:hypothetical protein LF1_16260 [Rubripirellula obstinata]